MNINYVNQSTVMTDEQVQKIAAAVQIQLNRDLEAGWGIGAGDTITCVAPEVAKASTDPDIIFLDDSDQQGALGYHFDAKGKPQGYVFARTDLRYGYTVSITASHETLELRGDPTADWRTLSPDKTRLYLIELCDACEADAYAYAINGILVSDFCLPAFYGFPPRTVPVRYDFCGHITRPFTILTGGYLAYYDLKSGRWVQDTNSRPARQSEKEYAAKSRFLSLQQLVNYDNLPQLP